MTSHWGALPGREETDPGIAALEWEQMTKLRAMEVEGSRLQCSSGQQLMSTKQFAIDDVTLHTISLLQFIKKIRSLILSVQQQRENLQSGEGDVLNFPPTPAVPEFPLSSPKHVTEKKYPFMVKDLESDFARGFGKPPPELDAASNHCLLRRSVAAVCAHAGFDTCADSVLETLTSVCHTYFLRITKLLRSAVDNEALNGPAGFQDVIQLMSHEVGLGSPTVFHEFYQSRIVQYRSNLLVKCEQLIKEYEHVTSSSYSPVQTKLINIKEEPMSEDIIFPLTDDRQDNEEDIDETEELLQLAGLSGFDIKLEQDPGTGISSDEVDSQTVKADLVDTRLLEAYGDPDSITEHNPRTPHFSGDLGDNLQETTLMSAQIMSPPPLATRPRKKRKR